MICTKSKEKLGDSNSGESELFLKKRVSIDYIDSSFEKIWEITSEGGGKALNTLLDECDQYILPITTYTEEEMAVIEHNRELLRQEADIDLRFAGDEAARLAARARLPPGRLMPAIRIVC